MARHRLRFRQIHLDFHTAPQIEGIGAEFDRRRWQDALRAGHVDSITCFAKCHHGWSYHPTTAGKMHPHLKFDLLRAQFEAAKELNVNVPIYISAGFDERLATEHREWLEHREPDQPVRPPPTAAGFRKLCFHSPYLDVFCAQVCEVVELFPDNDGLFLDIISQGECLCPACRAWLKRQGLSAEKAEDRRACSVAALERYYREATAAARALSADQPVFHNSGHVARGGRELIEKHFSHLELESLPTAGWGYDHFPLSAKYSQHLGLDFLGMTGRFHTMWGEFGGYKHPNALRYECAGMLAHGARCSVGDQLHPSGAMDESTYRIIGAAYAEVQAKEPWVRGAAPVADVAVLSAESEARARREAADAGAGRVLFESHVLFDVIDRQRDFAGYKLVILPDEIRVDAELRGKLEAYLASGGRLVLSGQSGLAAEGGGFTLDVGAEHCGTSPFQPDYLAAGPALAPSFTAGPVVMYMRSEQVRATSGEVLARIRNPYFNRTVEHFCSHLHAPPAGPSEFAAAVRKDNVLYLAHPIFSIYEARGAVACREYAAKAVRLMLADRETLSCSLPSTARVTLTRQAADSRYVLHLLYAERSLRGAPRTLSSDQFVRDTWAVEVIEDLLPLRDVRLALRLPEKVRRITFEPQGKEVPFEVEAGRLALTVDEFTCHQMVALHY